MLTGILVEYIESCLSISKNMVNVFKYGEKKKMINVTTKNIYTNEREKQTNKDE
jgi:hypothetical protein